MKENWAKFTYIEPINHYSTASELLIEPKIHQMANKIVAWAAQGAVCVIQ